MKKILTAVLAAAVLAIWIPSAASVLISKRPADLALFSKVLSLVRSDFVEERSTGQLITGAIDGLLRSLDPYSQLLDREAYQDLKNANEGRFGGIGLEFSFKDGEMTVIAPLDGSPAAQAGLLPGDHILQIDGKPTREMTLTRASHALRGQTGTAVVLSVLRDEKDKSVFDVSIERAKIQVPGVRESKILEPGIGYARIASFQKDTAAELRKSMEALRAQGVRALILDLRNNPGGPLDAALETAQLFVPAGKTIVTTRGRAPSKNTVRTSKAKETWAFEPLIILVNQGTASDSEILAGALQDHGLARIVGGRTYGKGSIQSVFSLSDQRAIRLTTSRYYTPNGSVIHEKGISPDTVVEAQKGDHEDRVLARALEIARGSA